MNDRHYILPNALLFFFGIIPNTLEHYDLSLSLTIHMQLDLSSSVYLRNNVSIKHLFVFLVTREKNELGCGLF